MYSAVWLAASFSIAAMMAWHGLSKRSLSRSGALAALGVGTLHLYCGLQYGLTLIFFYLSSSKLTRLQSEKKEQLEADFKPCGQRGGMQVLANSLGACISLVALLWCQWQQQRLGPGPLADQLIALQAVLTAAFLGHYCCCCADTWASELGILSTSPPRLITSLRTVPPGTNGGVSLLGTGSATAGACALGLVFLASSWVSRKLAPSPGDAMQHQVPSLLLLLASILLGLMGCIIDSVLGATLQFSGLDTKSRKVVQHPGKGVTCISGLPILSNDAVNMLSAALTSGVGALAMWQWLQLH